MIKIISIEWFEERQDWRVDYQDARNGLQRGNRHIALSRDATEADILSFIENEDT